MRHSARMSRYLGYLLLGVSIFLLPVALSDPRMTEAGLICGNTTQTDPSIFLNFNRLMNRMTRLLDTHMEGMDFISTPPPSIVGFAQCHTDLTEPECRACFFRARQIIETCRPAANGRVFLDGCFLRYDQKAIIGQFADKSNDRVNCSGAHGGSHQHPMGEFGSKVRSALQNVTRKAPHSKGFAVAVAKGEDEPVYALGQCWKLVSEEGCERCLLHAQHMLMSKCVPGSDGRALNAGCYLRYSTQKFYGDHAEEMTFDEMGLVTTVMTVMLCFFLLLLIGAIISYVRMKRMGQGNPFTRLLSSVNNSKINFKYEMLEKATDNFNPANKLGQGGAGSVFKGTLPDGRVVAVKRLFFSTRQWVDEFFNEVNLISETRHKNLVKLHGCSIEGPESLLVYEHVQNESLERHLFDRKKTRVLTWDQRMDIVRGIADGLAYLHGGFDSPVKIIHRDIKGSNVLLDENLVPKIADFGLARCVPGADESHISTGIAGTLGYMSPEYLVRGLLTEKADVYAFGVLAIEIVTGRKNSVFMQSSSSVLLSVYKHFKANRLSDAVDASLKRSFSVADASKVLQVGLLCTQTTPELRPTMPEVVQILNGTTNELPTPKDAPFVNASILGTDDTSSYSITETQSQDSFSTCLTDSTRSDSFSRLPQAR